VGVKRLAATAVILGLLGGCGRKPAEPPDHPRLAPGVALRDVTFVSAALHREMRYRVALPASVAASRELSVIYLLHGGGGRFQDWSNYSDVCEFVRAGLILVMPQGDYSYYVNAAERPADRYEDYIVEDLRADVESRFPAAKDRARRAIAGVSMGGFGSIRIALGHPDLFSFAGALSAPVDVPRRPFSFRRPRQYWAHREIFGPWNSAARRRNDPFVLARGADPAAAPYFFLACGDQEGLLPANRAFAAVLAHRHVRYEFHVTRGGHDWNQWNRELPRLFDCLLARLGSASLRSGAR
jgi:putative tributyrin esterase